MAITHGLVLEKLKDLPEDIRELAMSALELSESMPESTVAEHLKAVVRQLTKDREASQ